MRYDFTYGCGSSGTNNGNLMSWNSTGWDFTFSRTYGYDSLNRLSTLSSPSDLNGCTGLAWGYDAWGNPSNPQSWNRYAYVLNDPIDYVDPLGLTPPQYSCSTSDPLALGCNTTGSPFGGGGGGSCSLDGIDTPCGIVLSVIQAGGSTSTISGGAGGTFQIWTPGGSVTSDAGTADYPGYWTTVSLDLSSWSNFGGNSGGNSSWAWTFTKTFFGNFVSKQYWKSELGDGGCYAVFGEGFNSGGVSHIADLAPGGGVDDMIRQGGQAAALTYQMSKGLTVPLRSSIYRGILSGSEKAAVGVAAADFAARSGEGFIREVSAIRNGTCH